MRTRSDDSERLTTLHMRRCSLRPTKRAGFPASSSTWPAAPPWCRAVVARYRTRDALLLKETHIRIRQGRRRSALLFHKAAHASAPRRLPDDEGVVGEVFRESHDFDDGLAVTVQSLDRTHPGDFDSLREQPGSLWIRLRDGHHIAGDIIRRRPQGPLHESVGADVLGAEGPQLQNVARFPRLDDLTGQRREPRHFGGSGPLTLLCRKIACCERTWLLVRFHASMKVTLL